MGDETRSAPPSTHSGIWEHWCEHPGCKQWGAWGYASGRGPSNWYCWEHRPDAEDDGPRIPLVTSVGGE
jgi:hypothetical protein